MNERDKRVIRQAKYRLSLVAESAKDERWMYANGRIWQEIRHENGVVGAFPIATTIVEEDEQGQSENVGEFLAASFVTIRELLWIVTEQDKRVRHAEAERDELRKEIEAYDKRIVELETERDVAQRLLSELVQRANDVVEDACANAIHVEGGFVPIHSKLIARLTKACSKVRKTIESIESIVQIGKDDP